MQSPYFLGSAWFRRWPGVKTSLVLLIVLVVLAVSGLLSEALLRTAFDAHDWADRADRTETFRALAYSFFANADFLYAVLILTPPALWSLAWLRLRKIQTDDAI